jgi:hypothetical protein
MQYPNRLGVVFFFGGGHPPLGILFICFVFLRQCFSLCSPAGLKLKILLLPPPECWDYRCALSCPAPLYWYFYTDETIGLAIKQEQHVTFYRHHSWGRGMGLVRL